MNSGINSVLKVKVDDTEVQNSIKSMEKQFSQLSKKMDAIHKKAIATEKIVARSAGRGQAGVRSTGEITKLAKRADTDDLEPPMRRRRGSGGTGTETNLPREKSSAQKIDKLLSEVTNWGYAFGGLGGMYSGINQVRVLVRQLEKAYNYMSKEGTAKGATAITPKESQTLSLSQFRAGSRIQEKSQPSKNVFKQEIPTHMDTGKAFGEVLNNLRSFAKAPMKQKRTMASNASKEYLDRRKLFNVGQGQAELLEPLLANLLVGAASSTTGDLIFGKGGKGETENKAKSTVDTSMRRAFDKMIFKSEHGTAPISGGGTIENMLAKAAKPEFGMISYAKGGKVTATEPALVHKGEEIIPVGKTKEGLENSVIPEKDLKSSRSEPTQPISKTTQNDISVSIAGMNIYSPEDLEYEIQKVGSKLATELGKVS